MIGGRFAWAMAVCAACFGVVGVREARAQHSGDIILVAESGRVVTGIADSSGVELHHRVYNAAFGNLGLPNRTADPGVNSLPGMFVQNAQVDLRIRRAARKWSAADGNFCDVPEETIEIRKGTRTIATPATDPTDGAGGPIITMGFTDPSDGLIHQHPAYWLTGAAADGVYLLELQVEATGLQPSLPAWIVFSQNAQAADVADALAFAEETLEEGSGNLCRCRADVNDDGDVSADDIFAFLDRWFAESGSGGGTGRLRADFDRNGTVSADDIFAFLDRWFGGC